MKPIEAHYWLAKVSRIREGADEIVYAGQKAVYYRRELDKLIDELKEA